MIQLPEMPSQIAALPHDERGYPVPWFVAWIDGKPVFPVADQRKVVLAVRDKRCWVCGEPMGRNLAFVIGPMCTVNRVSAEPPCHLECGLFSARACPFLTKPNMRRMDVSGIVDTQNPGGTMIHRNPGVVCVWSTRFMKMTPAGKGVIFRIGDPTRVDWFAEGRPATREEVLVSMESGLPALRKIADDEAPEAVWELRRMLAESMQFVPV